MLGIIRNLWHRLTAEPRDIYEFWDGRRWRRADPIVVSRRLQSHKDFDPEKHPGLVDMGDDEAIAVTSQAVRDAFGLPEFNGRSGLTESECLSLLAGFWDWCGDLKKKVNRLPNLPEPTEPESLGSLSTTARWSDSGSTLVASSDGEAGL